MEAVKGQEGQGQGELVAQHYNQLQEAGRESRTESRIFFMRNFNNWIKSVVISMYLMCYSWIGVVISPLKWIINYGEFKIYI